MRLDKFLKVSRLIKRRTVANEACDAGRVLVNGKPAKASVKVKIGDVIEIQFGTKIAAIAYSVGFENNLYFSKAFKSRTHMSPSAYREVSVGESSKGFNLSR